MQRWQLSNTRHSTTRNRKRRRSRRNPRRSEPCSLHSPPASWVTNRTDVPNVGSFLFIMSYVTSCESGGNLGGLYRKNSSRHSAGGSTTVTRGLYGSYAKSRNKSRADPRTLR